jgi:lysophospholipase L1-like esterase
MGEKTGMAGSRRIGRGTAAALALLGAIAALSVVLAPAGRSARAGIDRCTAPSELTSLGVPLAQTARRLREGGPLTIVALGSSSTEGVGASRPENSYPSRLALVLKAWFPGVAIRVVNRGVGGETAPQMAARIERDVLPERPDLVIWQVGTNIVIRDQDPLAEADALHDGIARLRAAGSDIVLMDLQYAPAVLMHAQYREMLHVLAAIARSEDIALFHRFAVMRHWAEEGRMPIPVMLGADRLHMTDASYDCLARQVGVGIFSATRPRAVAETPLPRG